LNQNGGNSELRITSSEARNLKSYIIYSDEKSHPLSKTEPHYGFEMQRVQVNPELAVFATSLITEAQSQSGTWSLSTYSTLRAMAPRFSRMEAAALASRIMEAVLNPDASPSTRYKLAQLTSLITKMGVDVFRGVFLPFEGKVTDICSTIEDSHELAVPTVKLLMSLFRQSGSERQASASAPKSGVSRLKLPKRAPITPQPLLGFPEDISKE
jgi:hypothetical protein